MLMVSLFMVVSEEQTLRAELKVSYEVIGITTSMKYN
jgi:hypothetical protein